MRGLQNSRVLVVDDGDFNLELARCVWEQCGVSVTTVSSGLAAVEFRQSGQFDGVLRNDQMPVMDGIEPPLRVRSAPRYADTCVIALTANASFRDRERYLLAGMNDVIAKPWLAEQLIDALERNVLTGNQPQRADAAGTFDAIGHNESTFCPGQSLQVLLL